MQLVVVIKSMGMHKYDRREPDGRGGWRYYYRNTPVAAAAHRPLVFREHDQNPHRVAEWAEAIQEGAPVPPVVEVDGEVIDGHHRALAYQQLGQEPPTITLTRTEEAQLRAAGYDAMEIAAAAHLVCADGYGAELIDQQFPGANVWNRAADAAELLERTR